MSPGAAEADGMSGPARLRGYSGARMNGTKKRRPRCPPCHKLKGARGASPLPWPQTREAAPDPGVCAVGPRGPSTEFFQELRFEMSIRYPGVFFLPRLGLTKWT
ncbi:hypothetical protein MTO96_026786 [Rhipicephalus appendiculatus]